MLNHWTIPNTKSYRRSVALWWHSDETPGGRILQFSPTLTATHKEHAIRRQTVCSVVNYWWSAAIEMTRGHFPSWKSLPHVFRHKLQMRPVKPALKYSMLTVTADEIVEDQHLLGVKGVGLNIEAMSQKQKRCWTKVAKIVGWERHGAPRTQKIGEERWGNEERN